MSGWIRAVLAGIAVLAGVSPLLWVTATEYRVLAQADALQRDRQALIECANEMVRTGAMEQLGALVSETRERHPDDDALARELAMILLQSAHKQPVAGQARGNSH